MTNLVTGATGLLGMRIVFDLLKTGQEVRALRRENSDLEIVKKVFQFYDKAEGENYFNKINWVVGDVLDIYALEAALEGVSYVYHCAAMVSFHPKDFDSMYVVNQKGTENVVNLSIDAGVKHLCHISSIAAIGRSKIGQEINEKTEWANSKFNSNYAISKYSSEREVWRAMEEGLSATILNPGIIFGAGATAKSSATLFSTVSDGLKFHTAGSGSFVDARDVSEIALRSVEQKINRERFILVSENKPMRTIFEAIAVNMGKTPPKYFAGKFLLGLGWRISAMKDFFFGTKSPLTKESARAAATGFDFNNEKAKKRFEIDFISCQESISFFGEFYLPLP